MADHTFLILDRDPVLCARTIVDLMDGGYRVLAFDDEQGVLQALSESRGDIVLVFDRDEPKHDDNQGTQQATQQAATAFAIECMRSGAIDFMRLRPQTDDDSILKVASTAIAQADSRTRARRHNANEERQGVEEINGSVRDIAVYARRLMETAQATKHFTNCTTFPELATQALTVLRSNLDAAGAALFLLTGNEWRMMHASDLAHDLAQTAPHDVDLSQAFADSDATSHAVGRGVLNRFLRKSRGAIAGFALRSPAGELLGLLILHRPTSSSFSRRDLELGRLILAHVAEALKSIRLTDSLRESEARFHSIASNVPGVVFQARCGLGEILKFVYMSDSSNEIFGVRPDRFLFSPVVFLERVVVDDLPILLRSLRDAVGTLSPWNWEGRVRGPCDRIRWIQLSARPNALKEHRGEVPYDGLMLDITDAKELEFQLQLSDRMASVGTLAAGVAHEINNPLTYVLTNLGLIREEIRDVVAPEVRIDIETMLDEAAEGAERVTNIVRDLKVFSRGEERSTAEATDVTKVLESALKMASNEIRHRAELVKDYRPVPAVLGNDARLGQVFLNLLINAAQAIPTGRADENKISITTSTDDDGRAVVSISDTGNGIPEDARKRIFDPFFTTKAVGVGTGLGLSICHRIVDDMGGEISVDSASGRGTTFTLVLPPSKTDVVETKRERPAPIVMRRRARVLIVDDERGVVSALHRGLRHHDVRTALSGRAALKELEEDSSVDVILCDLMMPDISGIELYAHIQKEFPGLEHSVVFMTGGAFTSRAKEFLRARSNLQVSKPFKLRDIEQVIKEQLGEESADFPLVALSSPRTSSSS